MYKRVLRDTNNRVALPFDNMEHGYHYTKRRRTDRLDIRHSREPDKFSTVGRASPIKGCFGAEAFRAPPAKGMPRKVFAPESARDKEKRRNKRPSPPILGDPKQPLKNLHSQRAAPEAVSIHSVAASASRVYDSTERVMNTISETRRTFESVS